MKRNVGILLVVILFLTQACSARNATEASSPQEPIAPPATETSMPDIVQPTVETTLPEISQSITANSTTVVLPALPTQPAEATDAFIFGANPLPEGGITLEDKGKTFNMKVGDSFLLNLGTDIYDWTVTVDNENILHLKMGVMVIRGAQGIYDALALGTATLSAIGNPVCLQSSPPCTMPSILFSVTLIVKE